MERDDLKSALYELVEMGYVEGREVNGEIKYFLTDKGKRYQEENVDRITRGTQLMQSAGLRLVNPVNPVTFPAVEKEVFWTVPKIILAVAALFLLLWVSLLACNIISLPLWFASRSVEVVKQQVDPAELLRKYELFKDEAAQLDAKNASIKIKRSQIAAMKSMPMDRTNREQLMIWQQELGGMQYSFNALAADYNAQMAKINYRFTNVGDLPAGATTPLPREYKPYQEE